MIEHTLRSLKGVKFKMADGVLERIADSLERLVKILENSEDNLKILNESKEVKDILEVNKATSLEEELFKIVTEVYLEEERSVRNNSHKKRKSGVRISRNLTEKLKDFFEKQLPALDITIDRGYLFFNKNNICVAMFKFYTDLSWHRGDEFYKTLKEIHNVSKENNISSDNIFIMVGSMVNSLEIKSIKYLLEIDENNDPSYLIQDHVKQRNSSIDEITEEQTELEKYIEVYMSFIDKHTLEEPQNQIYFLAVDQHPNQEATNILNNKNYKLRLEEYQILRPSVTEFINYMRKKYF